jgi:hypothetical protein
MIYAELKNYLIHITNIETIDLFDDAVDVFEKYQMITYMDVFETTITGMTDEPADEILCQLEQNLRTALIYLLTLQGVTANEDTCTSYIVMIADALYELPYYEDKQTLKDILDNDDPDIEKFCCLLCLASPLTIDEGLSLLISVDENFIINFKSQIKDADLKVEEGKVLKEYIELYKKFKRVIAKNAAHYADRFFLEIGAIGLDFEVYLNQYKIDKEKLTPYTDCTEAEGVAKVLLGLACISKEGYANAIATIKEKLSMIYSDLTFTTNVDIALSKYTIELHRE